MLSWIGYVLLQVLEGGSVHYVSGMPGPGCKKTACRSPTTCSGLDYLCHNSRKVKSSLLSLQMQKWVSSRLYSWPDSVMFSSCPWLGDVRCLLMGVWRLECGVHSKTSSFLPWLEHFLSLSIMFAVLPSSSHRGIFHHIIEHDVHWLSTCLLS